MTDTQVEISFRKIGGGRGKREANEKDIRLKTIFQRRRARIVIISRHWNVALSVDFYDMMMEFPALSSDIVHIYISKQRL